MTILLKNQRFSVAMCLSCFLRMWRINCTSKYTTTVWSKCYGTAPRGWLSCWGRLKCISIKSSNHMRKDRARIIFFGLDLWRNPSDSTVWVLQVGDSFLGKNISCGTRLRHKLSTIALVHSRYILSRTGAELLKCSEFYHFVFIIEKRKQGEAAYKVCISYWHLLGFKYMNL